MDIKSLLGEVHLGDTFEFCKNVPDESVDFIMTSPPYWSLRDYGHEGQFGAERTPGDYVEKFLELTEQLYRMAKKTGSFWLNIGDKVVDREMLGIPWTVALQMNGQGWRMSDCVVWRKTNPMPLSDEKRLCPTYEFLFHFTKSPQYWCDLHAVRVPHSFTSLKRLNELKNNGVLIKNGGNGGRGKYKTKDNEETHRQGFNKEREETETFMHPMGKNPGDVWDIATASLNQEHFAAYPEELVLRPILMTCPPHVCDICGFLRERIIDTSTYPATTTGWTECKCKGNYSPGVGFDPFSGAGTTCLQLKKQFRQWFGVEINPKYREDSLRRITRDAGSLF